MLFCGVITLVWKHCSWKTASLCKSEETVEKGVDWHKKVNFACQAEQAEARQQRNKNGNYHSRHADYIVEGPKQNENVI